MWLLTEGSLVNLDHVYDIASSSPRTGLVLQGCNGLTVISTQSPAEADTLIVVLSRRLELGVHLVRVDDVLEEIRQKSELQTTCSDKNS